MLTATRPIRRQPARPAPVRSGKEEQPFWQQSLESLLTSLQTSPAGLTAREAGRRLQTFGPNEPAGAKRAAVLVEVLSFLANPLVIILLAASIVSAVLGEVTNAGVIALIVALSLVLNFFQAFRSQRAANELRRLVATHATALRNGQWVEVPMSSVVPGDVVRLGAGDLVPADGRLIEEKDLSINQSALTGESFPAEKAVRDEQPTGRSTALDDADNAVFLGTSVVSGTGLAVIARTGSATELGRIGERLRGRPPETEFERGTRGFSLLITRTVIFLVVFVFLVNTLARREALESFLFAIALAVGLTPEFLPMIVSVTLAQGALRMAKKKVIVKHLPSIENFGSMDILCTDKTGTITLGEIDLEGCVDWRGEPNPRVLELACLNSAYETGIKSPLDQAILKRQPPRLPAARKLDEIPFDFERRRLSVVLDVEGKNLLIAKGAPEGVAAACSAYEVEDGPRPMDEAARATLHQTFVRLSSDGLRLLAVAYREVEARASYGVADEHDLVLAGFLTFLDPPAETASATLQALKTDGLQVKILTGDNGLVTRHVCEKVDLPVDQMLTGEDLNRIPEEALGAIAERTTVFARVSPAQKHRILQALKARGHVVGFLGDGINDAPSLRAADVGISVANAVDVAKDAADIILMEHSLRVLHDGVLEGRKSFGNIMKYVLMGTSSNFGNMFSMAGASIFLPFLPMLPAQILLNNFLYDLSQVTIPSDNVDATYLQKPKRWNVSFIQRFMLIIGPISSIYDFLTFFVLLQFFHASEVLFHTGWFIESLATQTLVIFVIRTAGNPFKSRSSLALALSVPACVLIGVGLSFSPWASAFGFDVPPPAFFLVLIGMVATYLGLVELVKRWFYRGAVY